MPGYMMIGAYSFNSISFSFPFVENGLLGILIFKKLHFKLLEMEFSLKLS
jgi:hypothetical protein